MTGLDVTNLTMADAATACGHSKPVIQQWPESPDGRDRMAAEELADLARTIADLLARKCRHVPDSSRREMAEYIADALANAMIDVGGRLDGAAFVGLCDLSVVAA